MKVRKLIQYFDCGNVYKQSNEAVYFVVTGIFDLNDKVIPFFRKHPILGNKARDFEDWCKAVELMKKNIWQQKGMNKSVKLKLEWILVG